jgi:hypothetical protein
VHNTYEITGDANNNFPRNREEIAFYPKWGMFYFMSYGQLVFYHDKTIDRENQEQTDTDAYPNAYELDPCNRDTPIF